MPNISLVHIQLDELKTILSEVISEQLKSHLPAPPEAFDGYPEFLTRRQVADLLGVSLASIDNWANSGRLTREKFGKTVRFKKKDILSSLGVLEKYKRQVPDKDHM